jgi:hypothetical protein
MTKESAQTKAARAMVKARWAKTTPEERSAYAVWLNAQRSPESRRSDKPRCPCGKMTLARALANRHKCAAPETAQPGKKPKGK